jgi:predicted nucleic acid-binding Zn ribbon protein
MSPPARCPVPPESERPGGPEDASAADLAAQSLARARADARSNPQRRKRRATVRSSTDPLLLGEAVEDLVRDHGWQDERAAGGLFGAWGEIVGADLAEHVRPERFEPGEPGGTGGVLHLRADSTAWATQVRLLSRQLRVRIDEELGSGIVASIRVSGPAAPQWNTGRRRVPGRGPRDTYG